MKLIIALCLFAVAAAQVQISRTPSNNVELLRYNKESTDDGSYNFNFEQSDGQRREERGQVTNAGQDNQSYSVRGSYYWVGPDGVEYTVIYEADENGYKPEIQQGPGGAVPAIVASMVG